MRHLETKGHPRPDRVRSCWWPLDGSWDFAFDDADRGLSERWFDGGPIEGEIRVPFPHQAPASGVGDAGVHPVVWYRKTLRLPERESGRLLLHFGAVDQSCTIWIDGGEVGANEGGYVPFAIDVTDRADREVSLAVRAVDRTAPERPRGKQMADRRARGAHSAIRYTASTGIWQSVWIERVGASFIADFRVRAAAEGALSQADHERMMAEWERGIRRDRNHPSAVCWSPYNETWSIAGVRHDPALQARVSEAVARTRSLVPDELVVDNSGWHHVETDLFDLHNYTVDPERLTHVLSRARDADWRTEWRVEFEPKGPPERFAGPDGWIRFDSTPLCDGVSYWGQPVVLSEMGGVGCVLEGDRPHPERYVVAETGTPDDLARSLEALVGAVEALGFAGWCWTQLSDIEQEENGLLSYDRRAKLPAARVAAILAAAARRRPVRT